MSAKNIISNMSIKAKLFALAGLLLTALIATNLYSGGVVSGMRDGAATMEADIVKMEGEVRHVGEGLKNIERITRDLIVANNALREFGEMKYWMADLSASWLGESESAAEAAKNNLYALLDELAKGSPEQVKPLKGSVGSIYDLGIEAVDAYVDENRVKGNALLAKAKMEIYVVDRALVSIARKLQEEINAATVESGDRVTQAVVNAEHAIDNAEHFIANADSSLTSTRIALVVVAIAAILFTFLVIRSLIVPISRVAYIMEEQSQGRFNATLPPETSNEIGEMVRGLKAWRERAEATRMLREQQETEHKEQERRSAQMDQFTQEFDANISTFIADLSKATGELQDTSSSLNSLAENGASQATSLASATDNASNNVNTVASAAEELTASIGEINQQVNRSTEIARQAVEKAEGANTVIGGLLDSADKIGEVSALINDIAEQINLLALNATIEAARAGEAGKGFAVVASEVKNLATQTANATAEIGSHISKTQEETRNTAEVIKDISDTINEMNEISTAISAAMEEQGAATQEIARSIQQAAQSTNEASSAVSNVSESSSKTNQAAEQLGSASSNMASKSEALRQEVESFLNNIKAA